MHPKKQAVRGGMLGSEALVGVAQGESWDVGSPLGSTLAPSRSPECSLSVSFGRKVQEYVIHNHTSSGSKVQKNNVILRARQIRPHRNVWGGAEEGERIENLLKNRTTVIRSGRLWLSLSVLLTSLSAPDHFLLVFYPLWEVSFLTHACNPLHLVCIWAYVTILLCIFSPLSLL